jgi:DNA-binding beta-propeller fold protein YncE
MRNVVSIVCLTFASALIAGCSGGGLALPSPTVGVHAGHAQSSYATRFAPSPAEQGTPVPSLPIGPTSRGWLSPHAEADLSGQLLYVAEEYVSDVLIYSTAENNQGPVGSITAGVGVPFGLSIDNRGRLYVSDQASPCGPGGAVTVFRRGSLYPYATYAQDIYRPLFTIVDQYGDLFVGNGNAAEDGGTLVEFKAGSTHAYQVLQTPGSEVDGMDFDQQGNLYVAYRTAANYGSIEEFAPGSSHGQILGMSLYEAEGIIVDNNGNILVTQTGGPNNVLVFPPGATSPSLSIPLPSGSIPIELAISAKEQFLYVSSYTDGHVYKTDYPLGQNSTWTLIDQTPTSPIQGLALSQGQTF